MYTSFLLSALLALSNTLASPVRRGLGSDGVYTQVDVVYDMVYVDASNNAPLRTVLSTRTDQPMTPTPTAAITSAPFSNGNMSALIMPTPTGAVKACPQPLTVGSDGQPVLVGLLGGFTLGGCSFTATVTQNPSTLLNQATPTSALGGPVAAGAGTSPSAAMTTSSTIHPLFTMPSAYASEASTLTKVTAAPSFGAVLTPLSILVTASKSLDSAQQSGQPTFVPGKMR